MKIIGIYIFKSIEIIDFDSLLLNVVSGVEKIPVCIERYNE